MLAPTKSFKVAMVPTQTSFYPAHASGIQVGSGSFFVLCLFFFFSVLTTLSVKQNFHRLGRFGQFPSPLHPFLLQHRPSSTPVVNPRGHQALISRNDCMPSTLYCMWLCANGPWDGTTSPTPSFFQVKSWLTSLPTKLR